ncbi:MAG: allophanate hydrolase [Zoogloeaceae bacterium]|jgi:allophanate hydrolase|nr:allophanate hydrolase [Zoogloeaceae bacterium]
MSRQAEIQRAALDRASLHEAYAEGRFSPVDLVDEIHRRIAAESDRRIWLHLAPLEEARRQAEALRQQYAQREKPALYGLPYGLKDNIHVAGLPTTAACSALRDAARESATVVRRLDAAGAIFIGKQNLDQFATGLVGIRNPEGYCRNAFNPDYIPGGSSSGSAVAVAKGHVTFSIGSDTGGSGRVPAALNNIVGFKPTPGLVSNAGFLCNNRTFDVPPVLALTVPDARVVLDVIAGYDPLDPFSRQPPDDRDFLAPPRFRYAVPREKQLTFFGDAHAEVRYLAALDNLRAIGGVPVEIDLAPFLAANAVIFDSPFIAERALTYRQVIESHPEAIHPAVRDAILNARRFSAEETFQCLYRLAGLRQAAHALLRETAEVLALPTAGTIYCCAEVEANPVELNANLGRYTYFANPLHLCAVSIPTGLRPDGLPFGLSLIAAPFRETMLIQLGHRLHTVIGGTLGDGKQESGNSR